MSPREKAIAAADNWLLHQRHIAVQRAHSPMNDGRDLADLERSYLDEIEAIQAEHRALMDRIDRDHPKEEPDA